MAARSGASEGINLISSIYSDDDDDDDDMENIEHQETPNDDVNTTAMENDTRNTNSEERGVDFVEEDTPPLSSDRSRPLTPQQSQQQPQISLPSPPLQPPSRSRLHRLTIVDYGHDEVTLSPEAEDGEIVGAGVVMIGTQLQTTNGIQEKTPPGTAQVLSPSNKTDPQLSQQPDASESHTMNYAVNVSESTGIEEAVTVSMEASTDIDPFDGFLPPPPMAGCSDELQERINKFLYLKRLGKSYNAEVRKKKEYRNPDFLLHAVTYQDIDEIGSCFIKDVFDPHGYDKSDYCYEIEANMKRELERKEQEKKKSQKVYQLWLLVVYIQFQLQLILSLGMLGKIRSQSGIRWMVIEEIRCILEGRILYLQLVHMLRY